MTPAQRQEVWHHLSHELRRTLFEVDAEVSLDDDDPGPPMTFHVAVHTGGQPAAEGIVERFLAGMGAKARIVRTTNIRDGLPLSQTGIQPKVVP